MGANRLPYAMTCQGTSEIIGNSSAPSTTVAAIVASFRRRKAGISCAPPAATTAPTAASTNKSCCELRDPNTGLRTKLKTKDQTNEPDGVAAYTILD